MNTHIPPQEPGTPLDDGSSGTSDVDFARHPLRGPRPPPDPNPDPERDGPVDPDRRDDDPDPPDPTDSAGDTLGGSSRRR